MSEQTQPQERILLHGRRGSKRWWMLQEMRRMEQQGMRFQPVDAHIFYGYWQEDDPRRAGASVINKYG